jgi:hypothetical protein
MTIVLHIERLVLDEALLGGERAGDVRAAIERELARRFALPGTIDALRGIGAVDRLSASQLPHARDGRHPLSGRIAEAVGHGLGIEAGGNGGWKPAKGEVKP